MHKNESIKELNKTPINKLKDDVEIIRKIEYSIDKWYNDFSDNLDKAYDDTNFALGTQWGALEEAEFIVRQKIMLTINVMYSFVLNIVGEQRQNTPNLEVRALDPNIEQKIITFYEDLLRQIDYASKADVARQTAFMNALMGGFGAWRIAIDYDDEKSFNKKLYLQTIYDPFSNVYFDPNAQETTKSDGDFCGLHSTMSLEDFYQKYPHVDLPRSLEPPTVNMGRFRWRDNDCITIVEHFHKVYTKTKLYKLSNGECVVKKDLKERLKELNEIREIYTTRLNRIYMLSRDKNIDASPPPPMPEIKVEDERDTEICTIKHYKLIKDTILEEGVFPGNKLPIIFVDGDSHWINGKQETKSFISFAKDPQKFINMIMSDLAQMAKTGHKGEYLATEDMISDYKELWRNPEKYNIAKIYKPDPQAPGARPEYIPPAELPPSMVSATTNLFQMIQVTLGRFEANRGAQGNEQSGVAITNRAKQGNTSVFIYLDNLNRAIEQTGRICLDLIPEVYSDRGYASTRSREGKSSIIELDDSKKRIMKKQSFDVSVSAGASFEIQKQEAFAQLMSIIQLLQLPPTIVADLVAENTNLANTPQLIDRLRKFVVNPQIIAEESGQKAPPTPPDPQIIIAQKEAQARLMEAEAKIAKVKQDAQTGEVRAQAEIGKANIDYHAKAMEAMTDAKSRQLELENEQLKHQNEKHRNTLRALLSPYLER